MKTSDNKSLKTVFKIIVPNPDNDCLSISVSVINEHNEQYVLVENPDDESWIFPIVCKSHWKQISLAINTALKLWKE